MKTLTLLTIAMIAGFCTQAQNLNRAPVATVQPTPDSVMATPLRYQIGKRGADQRIWEKVVAETDEAGRVSETTRVATVELASGMHYRERGEWLETKEEFEVVPGFAVAHKGPHKVSLAYNLNTRGSVALTMPDGQAFRSQVLALYYIDPGTSQSVFIAGMQDCEGKVLGGNQVLYENAFKNYKADIRYHYSKAGFEQDVILRQRIPAPETFGLNPESTRLAVLTEFFDPPEVKVTRRDQDAARSTGAGAIDMELEDQDVSFGPMQIIRGKAFNLGADPYETPVKNPSRQRVPVIKKWATMEARHFLIEEVPVSAAQAELAKLPEQASLPRRSSRSLQAGLELPRQTQAGRTSSRTMQMASLGDELRAPGYVLDYFLVNVNTNDFVFQGDTTYLVSGKVTISGKITLEGGAVIKLSPTNNAEIYSTTGNFDCRTGPYRPCILTASSDDTIGEVISGSSGVPTNYLCGLEAYGGTPSLSHLSVRYAVYGISSTYSSATISDVQFVNCHVPLAFHYASARVRNCLFDRPQIPFSGMNYTYAVEHATVNDCSQFSHTWSGVGQIVMTNCIAVGLTNWGSANSILTNNSVASLTSMPSLFQTVAAGNFYLATNSPYRNVGWTNINSTLLAELGKKTTYPPILYSNVTFSAATVLTPQVLRDVDTPDMGYHYEPLDFLVDKLTITNAPLTVTNGVAIGAYLDNPGIWLQDGSSISAIGTASQPIHFTFYNTVQEQPLFLSSLARSNFSYACLINPYHYGDTLTSAATGIFRFGKFTGLANSGVAFYHAKTSWDFRDLLVQDCEIRMMYGYSSIFVNSNTTTAFINSLFYRTPINAQSAIGAQLSFSNNLFWTSTSISMRPSGGNLFAFNNAFDFSTIGGGIGFLGGVLSNDFNGYFNCTGKVPMTNAGPNNVIQTNALAYQVGPLGDFYQPSSSPLLDVGSDYASSVGLYHYTTTTNQVKEEWSMVDIGYHYVAVSASGLPVDSDNDGIPDYLEDANGDGWYGWPETDWNDGDMDDDGLPDGIDAEPWTYDYSLPAFTITAPAENASY